MESVRLQMEACRRGHIRRFRPGGRFLRPPTSPRKRHHLGCWRNCSRRKAEICRQKIQVPILRKWRIGTIHCNTNRNINNDCSSTKNAKQEPLNRAVWLRNRQVASSPHAMPRARPHTTVAHACQRSPRRNHGPESARYALPSAHAHRTSTHPNQCWKC